MTKFNTNVFTSARETLNKAGGLAYKMSTELELVQAVLSTFLKDSFYETGDERISRIKELVAKVDAVFVAKLAIIARNEFNLRSVTHVLIGELARVHKGDSLVRDTIVKCAIRPDDLTEIVSYIGTPIPKQVRRGVRRALLKFDRYQLAKYKMEGKKVSLVDLFNLCHPNPKHANEEQKQAWADLMVSKLPSVDTWETEISNTTDKKDAWSKLVMSGKIGYMALVRNINNLIKAGVDVDVIKTATARIADPEQVKKSRMLPFRFSTAYSNVSKNPTDSRLFLDSLSAAMDAAVSNTPELSGKTLIAIDGSGSMNSGHTPSPIDIATIFGATLAKANANSDVVIFSDTIATTPAFSTRTPVMDIASLLKNAGNYGGTETSLVLKHATKVFQDNKTKYDRIIIISDSESWVESYWGGSSVNDAYNAYKKSTGSDPSVYAIDICGNGTTLFKSNKVVKLSGWSDRLLDFIGKAEQGESLVEYINNYSIN
jgi:hypothetical protein